MVDHPFGSCVTESNLLAKLRGSPSTMSSINELDLIFDVTKSNSSTKLARIQAQVQ
jgi:hypothetical protein